MKRSRTALREASDRNLRGSALRGEIDQMRKVIDLIDLHFDRRIDAVTDNTRAVLAVFVIRHQAKRLLDDVARFDAGARESLLEPLDDIVLPHEERRCGLVSAGNRKAERCTI